MLLAAASNPLALLRWCLLNLIAQKTSISRYESFLWANTHKYTAVQADCKKTNCTPTNINSARGREFTRSDYTFGMTLKNKISVFFFCTKCVRLWDFRTRPADRARKRYFCTAPDSSAVDLRRSPLAPCRPLRRALCSCIFRDLVGKHVLRSHTRSQGQNTVDKAGECRHKIWVDYLVNLLCFCCSILGVEWVYISTIINMTCEPEPRPNCICRRWHDGAIVYGTTLVQTFYFCSRTINIRYFWAALTCYINSIVCTHNTIEFQKVT